MKHRLRDALNDLESELLKYKTARISCENKKR